MLILKNLTKIILFVLFAWLAVHALAVFGLFLFVGYLAWWIIAKNQTICFICRIKNEGERCPLCRSRVSKSQPHPKTILSAVINSLILFVLSLTSLAIVYVESQTLYQLRILPAEKSASFVIPPEKQYRLGEIIIQKIEITGIKVPINVVQADIQYNPTNLKIIDIATGESFANIFVQKEIDNERGYARLTGGVPNPGYSLPTGVFGTVYYQAIGSGVTEVKYLPSSMILANDGLGSDILKNLTPITYLILPDRISTEEEKTQLEVVADSSVLGVSDPGAQMKFYDEGEVLRASTIRPITPQVPSFNKRLLQTIKDVDYFILTQWKRLFSWITII